MSADDDPPSRQPCAMLFGAVPVDGSAGRRHKGSRSEPPERLLPDMNAPLRNAFQKIRELLARTSRDEVRSRYEVGIVVAEVKRSEHKYGARAVHVLGAALGTGAQTLYRYATVAEHWTSRQVESLLEQTNRHGQPLSWSHLVALSGVSSPRRRTELADRTLREGLSVRQLAALTESGATSGKAREALEKVLTATERGWSLVATLYEQVLEELTRVASGDARALEVLDGIIAAYEAQQTRVRLQVERLRAERARLGGPGVRKVEDPSAQTMADVGT